MNKYLQEPEHIIDLHGLTTSESKILLDDLVSDKNYSHVRIIIGKGLNSANGPILPFFVKNYLADRNIRFNQSNIQNGGEGSLEVFFD